MKCVVQENRGKQRPTSPETGSMTMESLPSTSLKGGHRKFGVGPSACSKCLVNIQQFEDNVLLSFLCIVKWEPGFTPELDFWTIEDGRVLKTEFKGGGEGRQLSHFALLLQRKQAYFVRDYFYSALLESFLHC